MLDDEAREEAAIHATRQVVPRRDRQEGARVVVEAYGVVEAGRLGGLLAEAPHALGAVVEPPGRAELENWIVSRERRQLAAVRALVEREQDQRQRALIAETIEQRAQRVDVLGPQ